MHKLLIVVLSGAAAVATSSPAMAQGWGYDRYGRAGSWNHDRYDGWYGTATSVCSGRRAEALEQRLRHEVREGEIDPRAAARIHGAIDRLEARQWHECRERDARAIFAIARQYDRIGRWIDEAAHGGWRDD